MQPEANDYGRAGDPARLVPEALRAYRHFGLHRSAGVLTPMRSTSSKGTYARSQAVFQAKCEAGFRVHGCPCSACRWYTGSCEKTTTHDAPDVTCRCGFYAHYDPATDFYPGHRWGSGSDVWTFTTIQAGPILRAVVDVLGTTIMGRKGVRAAKMKVVALAVDWEKFRVTEQGPDVGWKAVSPLDWTPSYAVDDRISYATQKIRTDPTPEEYADAEAATLAAAEAYGAKYYSRVDEMYAAYPPPDVEHLKPPERFDDVIPPSTLIYARQISGYFQVPLELLLPDGTDPKPEPKPKTRIKDPRWAAAIERKKNNGNTGRGPDQGRLDRRN